MALDEFSSRLPGWVEGVPVTLADGERWHLRRPSVSVSPVMSAGEVCEVRVGLSGVPDYDELCSVLYGDRPASHAAGWGARFAIAVILLRGNYALADGDYEELLSWTGDSPESRDAWETIVDVFLGVSPKPEPAG